MAEIPPLPSGFKRKWLRCRRCRKVYHYDYVPYSMSSPLSWPTCGHDEGRSDLNCDTIPEAEAREALELRRERLAAVAEGQRADAIVEVADLVRGWRNDQPMTADECANAILHHFGLAAPPLSKAG